MDLNNVRLDLEKEVAGVWVPVDATTDLLIGSINGPTYRKALREKMRAELEQLKGKELDEDAIERMTVECLADHILLGWRGLTEGGELVEYSKEKAKELLSNPVYRQFREFVSNKADDISLFRDKSKDKIAGEVKK